MTDNHLTITEIHPDNWRYYVEKPESDFSPQRNYAVINQVLAENDRMQTALDPRVISAAGDKADILASYGVYRFNKGTKPIEEYLGREWMAKIYGEKLLEKIRIADSVRRLNLAQGNNKFSNYFLT